MEYQQSVNTQDRRMRGGMVTTSSPVTRRRFRYRNYRPEDLDAMVALDALCFDAPFRFSRDAMRRFTEAENAWVILAENGQGLAGFCIVHREHSVGHPIGYVVTIDVAERWRSQGIGERMLSSAETWVQSWKGVGIMLHVFVRNERARRFYERLRYRRVGLQQGFYGPGMDAAMYWKDLTSSQR
jgi:ribosomal-protein-alanine N-acetyltransferase